jgi:hypothetical protein
MNGGRDEGLGQSGRNPDRFWPLGGSPVPPPPNPRNPLRCVVGPDPVEGCPGSAAAFLADGYGRGLRSEGRSSRVPAGGVGATSSA